MRHALFVAIALVGCAKGGVGQLAPGDGNGQIVDGTVYEDAPPDHEYHDAKVYQDAHEYHDAHVYMDAHVYQDAHVYMDACAAVQTQLLANPNFEGGTTGWHELDPEGELIVQPATINSNLASLPHDGTWVAWLGSYDHAQSDELFQDVAVPAGTTSLVLNGYWLVGTQENPNNAPYDTGTVALVNPTGETVIESALALNNLNATTTTTWTAFSKSFAVAGIAGTTVRLKFASTSDVTYLTNFFYDSLSLTATHCP